MNATALNTIAAKTTACCAATLIALSSFAAVAEPIESSLTPVYIASSQYTAILEPELQRWTLAPQVGSDLQILNTTPCARQTVPSKGLWLIGRDADGGLELVAPSATLLPEGHSGRIALRSCAAAAGSEVESFGVPDQVLELLADNTGAVLVDD
jgi:hypothetical protein